MKPTTTITSASLRRSKRLQLTFETSGNNWCLEPVRQAFGPGPAHYCYADGPWDLARLAETFSAQLARSYYTLVPNAEEGPQRWHELCIAFDEALYVRVDNDGLGVYADSPARALEVVEKLTRTFRKAPVPKIPCFQIVKKSGGCIDTESVAMDTVAVLGDEEFSLHYGDDFPAWNEHLLGRFHETRRGLSIFDGPPGTGKTSYIRQLMLQLKESHRFYFIGSANLHLLRDPEFVDFWAMERRLHEEVSLVIILEDAENALMPRSRDNREEVSLLLNLTDGILGEFLRLQVICTINCSLRELDPALLRPGRLLAHRHFGRLDRRSAERLAEHLKKPLPTAEDYSLAEVFSGELEKASKPRGLGFGA